MKPAGSLSVSLSHLKAEKELYAVMQKLRDAFVEVRRVKAEKRQLQKELDKVKLELSDVRGETLSINNHNNEEENEDEGCVKISQLREEQAEMLSLSKSREDSLEQLKNEQASIADETIKMKRKCEQQVIAERNIERSQAEVSASLARIQSICEETSRELVTEELQLQQLLEAKQNMLARLAKQSQSEKRIKHLHYELQQSAAHLQELLLKNTILNEQINSVVSLEADLVSDIQSITEDIKQIDEQLLENIDAKHNHEQQAQYFAQKKSSLHGDDDDEEEGDETSFDKIETI